MEDSLDNEIDAPTDVEATVDIEAPADSGQAEVIDTPIETDPTPSYDVVDLAEFEGKHVKVGDDYVPISELPNGYLRQSDYTRKTQEVSAERQELEQAANLWRAYQSNPQWTLNYLADQQGLTIAQAQQQVADAQQQTSNDWSDWDTSGDNAGADPLASRLEALEARLQREDVERQFDTVINGLSAKYDDFDPQVVADAAVKMNIFDPNMLEFVYHATAHQREQAAKQAATATVAERQAAEEAARRAAAQEAAATHTGSSAGATAPITVAPDRPLTPLEAATLAYEQMERDGLITS